MTTAERFWQYVLIPPDKFMCWNWIGGTSHGYGWFAYNGRNWRAPRVVLDLAGRLIPKLCVLHHCDNRRCVNPLHLFQGTRVENNRDRHAKNGYPPVNCENNPRAKITNEQAREIKRRCLAGEKRCEVAKDYGLSSVAVSFLVLGRTWKGI